MEDQRLAKASAPDGVSGDMRGKKSTKGQPGDQSAGEASQVDGDEEGDRCAEGAVRKPAVPAGGAVDRKDGQKRKKGRMWEDAVPASFFGATNELSREEKKLMQQVVPRKRARQTQTQTQRQTQTQTQTQTET